MFLTIMALDTSLPVTPPLLASHEAADHAVRSAFPPATQGILWTVSTWDYKTWLLILSPLRPDLTDLHSRYGYSGIFPSWQTIDTDRILQEIRDGSRWRFMLEASPTGPVRTMDVRMQDAAVLNLWLDSQAKGNGFQPIRLEQTGSRWLLHDSHTILAGSWIGELRVTDTDRFCRALLSGLGLGTAAGVGLLLPDISQLVLGF